MAAVAQQFGPISPADALVRQKQTIEDYTGFLAYLENNPDLAPDPISVDVYVQAMLSEFVYACYAVTAPERKQLEGRVARWEAARLQDLLRQERGREQMEFSGQDEGSGSAFGANEPWQSVGDVSSASKGSLDHGSGVRSADPTADHGGENHAAEAATPEVARLPPGASVELVDVVQQPATTMSVSEFNRRKRLLSSSTLNLDGGAGSASSSSNAANNKNRKDKKLEESEREAMLGAVANSVEQMVDVAHGISGRLQTDNKLLDKINEDMDKRTDTMAAKNQTARDMLWSSRMGFFTQLMLFAISVAVFFAMVSFILATKIINW
eukprot:g11027.t1